MPKNDLRKRHANSNFTFATKDCLGNIAIIFGPDSVLVLSIIDIAAIKQDNGNAHDIQDKTT